jgi:RNA polymerase sigma-70 factor (ECF subfamily)
MSDVKGRGISKYNIDIMFELYAKPLVNYANSFLNDFNLSEDIVQEVFLRLWEIRNEINIYNSLREYLFRSVRNKCINKRRNQKFEEKYQYDRTCITNEEQLILIQPNVEDKFQKLYQAMEHLTPKRKQILNYGLFGLKNSEIAEVMGDNH